VQRGLAVGVPTTATRCCRRPAAARARSAVATKRIGRSRLPTREITEAAGCRVCSAMRGLNTTTIVRRERIALPTVWVSELHSARIVHAPVAYHPTTEDCTASALSLSLTLSHVSLSLSLSASLCRSQRPELADGGYRAAAGRPHLPGVQVREGGWRLQRVVGQGGGERQRHSHLHRQGEAGGRVRHRLRYDHVRPSPCRAAL
jgi:hypothetical protein